MAVSSAQSEWIARVLGAGGAEAPAVVPGKGLAVWQREREAAISRLKQLSAAIAASGDVEARDAIVLVQAIVKNLAPKPDGPRAVAELERWLRTDDILDDAEAPNPFGIELNVRAPLLGALAQLGADFSAQAAATGG